MFKPAAPEDRTRDEILRAAGEEFADRGYRAATIRAICKRAGKNIALVKYHFGDKMELYSEVLRDAAGKLRIEELRSVFDEDAPPEQMLRNVIHTRLRHAWRKDLPGRYFILMAREMVEPTPALRRFIDEVSKPMFEKLRNLIARISGLKPEDEKCRLCANSVLGQIVLYVAHPGFVSQLWPELRMTPRQTDRIADHIADFSLAYLASLRVGTGGMTA